jgi:hypothetical protein
MNLNQTVRFGAYRWWEHAVRYRQNGEEDLTEGMVLHDVEAEVEIELGRINIIICINWKKKSAKSILFGEHLKHG